MRIAHRFFLSFAVGTNADQLVIVLNQFEAILRCNFTLKYFEGFKLELNDLVAPMADEVIMVLLPKYGLISMLFSRENSRAPPLRSLGALTSAAGIGRATRCQIAPRLSPAWIWGADYRDYVSSKEAPLAGQRAVSMGFYCILGVAGTVSRRRADQVSKCRLAKGAAGPVERFPT